MMRSTLITRALESLVAFILKSSDQRLIHCGNLNSTSIILTIHDCLFEFNKSSVLREWFGFASVLVESLPDLKNVLMSNCAQPWFSRRSKSVNRLK